MGVICDISVVVSTKNRSQQVKRFMESLDIQIQLPDELIIVDASEDNRTFELIENKNQSSKYPLKYFKAAPGLTRQRNIGIRKSNGKCVFFFDDDVVLEPNFIDIVYNTFLDFEGHNVGGVTGRMTNIIREGNLHDDLLKKVFFLTDRGVGKLKHSGFPAHRMDKKTAFVEVFSGFCMAYSREVLSKYLFDERLSGYSYMEDIDFSYRVSKEFKLVYQPAAKLEHLATTFKTANSMTLRRMMIQNHSYLFRKNLPQNIVHIFAHLMSILGVFLNNLVFLKDLKACIGVAEGFWNGTIRRKGPYRPKA